MVGVEDWGIISCVHFFDGCRGIWFRLGQGGGFFIVWFVLFFCFVSTRITFFLKRQFLSLYSIVHSLGIDFDGCNVDSRPR